MGILSSPLSCHSDLKKSQSNHLHSDSSIYLSSQPSLPSVPSLTLQHDRQPQTAHQRCVSTLKGHSSAVFSLTLAGKFIYSGSSDKDIRAWPRDPSLIQNSTPNTVAAGHGAVKSLVTLGGKLFSAHQDHKIRVWKIDPDQKHCKCIATLPTAGDRFLRLLSPKNYVKVRRHKKCTWVHHVDAVSALAVSADGSLLYSVSWDRTLKLWRTSDFRCLESVANAHDDAINAVAVSVDGFVYTGSADKKIKVWKKSTNKHSLVTTLEKHISAVNALALSLDGSVLYSGACDRSIVVWERVSCGVGYGHMVVTGALRGHTKAILCLAVVADLVCSGSADGTVRVWRRGIESERRRYSCLAVFEGHKGPVKSLTAAVDNGGGSGSESTTSYLVYSGSLDCDIKAWQICVPFL
ncbi:protein JINGUBANG [Malania oleifera]|uniref:protein JINGUBANG n=1 Tax=Malania oleifera TaxID=397392 RepID=UPI0025AE983B|nr:protein JINGUBANG [Malania oleifera]